MENVNKMEIKLQRRKNCGYSIPVCINGRELSFLFDTGCQRSVFFSKSVKKLKLEPHQVEFIMNDSCGSRKKIHNEVETDIEIGKLRFEKTQFLLIEGKNYLSRKQFDGILGMDVLGKLNFIINFPEDKIYIYGFSQSNNVVEYVDVRVNNINTTAMFDTGSNHSWISDVNIFSEFAYKKRYILQSSINRIQVKQQKEYQNIMLQGKCFKCYHSSVIEGRKVFRNGILMGMVIGLDGLEDKKLKYENGCYNVQQ